SPSGNRTSIHAYRGMIGTTGFRAHLFPSWCTESEIRSIVRGLICQVSSRQAALLGLTVPRGTLSASRLVWRLFSSAPLSSEPLTQYTSERRFGRIVPCHAISSAPP